MFDLTKLKTLKQLIQTNKEFDESMQYFMDNFSESPEFMELCDRKTSDNMLERILTGVGQQVFKKKNIQIQQQMFMTIDQYNFVHGPVLIEHHLMIIAYFSDIKMGVFALHQESQVLYGRINATLLTNFKMPPNVSLN